MAEPNDTDATARRYNDAEVRQLLERAAQMQGRPPAAVRSQGLTLAQLEEVAAEAHIDVARLRQAARELDMQAAARGSGPIARFAGAPFRIDAGHTLPFELDADQLGVLVESIAAAFGESGTSSLVGRTLTWSAHASSGRRTEVRVTVNRGRTQLRIDERYSELAGGLFGGVIGGVGGGVGFGVGNAAAGVLGSVAMAVAFSVAIIAGTYGACRIGYGSYVRNRARRVTEACERLVLDITGLQRARPGVNRSRNRRSSPPFATNVADSSGSSANPSGQDVRPRP